MKDPTPDAMTGKTDPSSKTARPAEDAAALGAALRDAILTQPRAILDDRDLMRALIDADDRALGANVVDIRGIAIQRLEARLGRLEDTHRSVIAAAYENLVGTTQVHRAVLRLLEPTEFEGVLRVLGRDVADILRVERIKLVLESHRDDFGPLMRKLGGVLQVAEPGFVDDYLTQGKGGESRRVVLRTLGLDEGGLYGRDAGRIASEAAIRVDLGAGRLPGLLALGATDPQQFAPSQGTDLLEFLGGAFERAMRRWLA
jgi:uncharacterized protein YigA (DUF484 family)